MSGFGNAPFGVGPYGVGTPAIAPSLQGVIYADPTTGRSLSGRLVDPGTKQYVYNSNGLAIGVSSARQVVELALRTVFNSSGVAGMGFDPTRSPEVKPDFVNQLTAAVRDALADAINRGLITLQQVDVQLQNGRPPARITARFIDLVTGLPDQVSV